jgi:hypothetical protein
MLLDSDKHAPGRRGRRAAVRHSMRCSKIYTVGETLHLPPLISGRGDPLELHALVNSLLRGIELGYPGCNHTSSAPSNQVGYRTFGVHE